MKKLLLILMLLLLYFELILTETHISSSVQWKKLKKELKNDGLLVLYKRKIRDTSKLLKAVSQLNPETPIYRIENVDYDHELFHYTVHDTTIIYLRITSCSMYYYHIQSAKQFSKLINWFNQKQEDCSRSPTQFEMAYEQMQPRDAQNLTEYCFLERIVMNHPKLRIRLTQFQPSESSTFGNNQSSIKLCRFGTTCERHQLNIKNRTLSSNVVTFFKKRWINYSPNVERLLPKSIPSFHLLIFNSKDAQDARIKQLKRLHESQKHHIASFLILLEIAPSDEYASIEFMNCTIRKNQSLILYSVIDRKMMLVLDLKDKEVGFVTDFVFSVSEHKISPRSLFAILGMQDDIQISGLSSIITDNQDLLNSLYERLASIPHQNNNPRPPTLHHSSKLFRSVLAIRNDSLFSTLIHHGSSNDEHISRLLAFLFEHDPQHAAQNESTTEGGEDYSHLADL